MSALEYLDEEVSNLAEVALRFCLSFGEISSIIIGVRSIDELETNLAALDKGPFPEQVLEGLRDFSLDDVRLVSPTQWGWT